MDWTNYRAYFEREASAYFGRPVTIAGKAHLRILPTPVVSFTDIRVGDAAEPEVQMERFRAEVELAPLLKGEVRVVHMTVERPRFVLDIGVLTGNGAAQAEGGWRIQPERISLGRLEILEGTALIEDSGAGRSWRAEGIDAVVEAGSLRGPGRAEAAFELDGIPVDVRAAFGRLEADASVSAKIAVTSSLYPATLAADGTIGFAAGAPRYAGTLTLAGLEADHSDEPDSPWTEFRAFGAFDLTPAELAIEGAQISYGGMERPLVLEGAGRLTLDAEPRFDASLRARQIDVDQALGGGPDDPVPVETAAQAFLDALADLPLASLPGSLRLEAQGVVVGGSVIEAVAADLATAADGWRIENFAARLPGETRLALDGALRLAPEAAFEGRATFASERPSALAAWWRGRVGSAGDIGRFAIEADLALSADRQQLSEVVVTTGEGTATGSLDLHRLPQSGERFANAVLSADRADLTEAWALVALLAGDDAADEIDQMTLSLDAEALVLHGIEARSVLLNGGLEGGRLELRRLSIADLAGASIDASGSIADPFGTPTGRLEASVTAEDIAGAAEFLAALAPDHPAVVHLNRVAPVLSPVRADVSAEIGANGDPLSLDLAGSFGDTHVTLAAAGRGSLAEPNSLSGSVRLEVTGDDSADMLTQLGLAPLPVRSGPVEVEAQFQGMLASAGTLEMGGTVAGVDFTYTAETALQGDAVALIGEVEAESDDIDPALLMAGFAIPGLGQGHEAAVRGRLEIGDGQLNLAFEKASFDGQQVRGTVAAEFGETVGLSGELDLETASLPLFAAFATGEVPAAGADGWSDAAVASPLPAGVTLDFAVTAAALDLGVEPPASDASLRLRFSSEELDLELSQAEFAGGALDGSLAASVRDGAADVAVRAGLTGADLQALVWERGGLPVASGELDGSVELAGSGRSLAGLVASLAGSGSFAIRDGRFNTLNPKALANVMQAAEADEEPDEEQARETFAIHFGSGALPFGQATGSFSVAAGVVDVATVSLAAGDATVLADAAFDLNTLSLASDWTIRTDDGAASDEAEPRVNVLFSGSITDPERHTDLAPLLDLLRSRYMQRQLDEIEALEAERRRAEAQAAAKAAAAAEAAKAAAAAAAEAEAAARAHPTSTIDFARAAGRAEAPAAPAETLPDAPASTASVEPAPTPDAEMADGGGSVGETPAGVEDAGAPEEPRGVLRRLAPAFRDVVEEDLEDATRAAPARPAARSRAPARRQAPPAPAADAPAADEPAGGDEPAATVTTDDGSYRMLPNGVLMKVR